jgi:glycerol-1-phosphatase
VKLVAGCDLDGVIWRGDEPIEGSSEAVARLRDASFDVVFITNNSSTTPGAYVEKLQRFGIQADVDHIVTSALAGSYMVAQHCVQGARVLACAGDGVREALADDGFVVVDDGPADAVVVGWHKEFDFERLRVAADAVRAGAVFIATNTDATYPGANGSVLPGNGSIVAAVATAGGRLPLVAGKPHAAMAAYVCDRFGNHGVMIGDRISTDGLFANALGWPFGLVLSGIAGSPGGEEVTDSDARWIAADLRALVAQLLDSGPGEIAS